MFAYRDERWCRGMSDKGDVFAKLMHWATSKGIVVKFVPFKYHNGIIRGNRLGIRQTIQTIEEINYTLAHEIAHAYLHFDKGDTTNSDIHDQYEEQADRAAKMILDLLTEQQEC